MERRLPSSAANSSTRTRRFRARTPRPSSPRGTASWPPGSAARARARPMSASGSRATSTAKWGAPVEVANGVQADGTRHPCWNPVLFETAPGTLTLFYKVGPSPQRWWGMTRTSARQRQDVERSDPAAGRHSRPDQEQAGAARRRDDPQPDEHRVDGAAEQVARALRAQHRWRQDVDDRPPRRRPPTSTPSSRASSFIRKGGCRRSDGRDPGVSSRRGRRTAARAGRR